MKRCFTFIAMMVFMLTCARTALGVYVDYDLGENSTINCEELENETLSCYLVVSMMDNSEADMLDLVGSDSNFDRSIYVDSENGVYKTFSSPSCSVLPEKISCYAPLNEFFDGAMGIKAGMDILSIRLVLVQDVGNFTVRLSSDDAYLVDASIDEIPGDTSDMDSDGVLDNDDNCQEMYNPKQGDSDGDGVGNACDNCMLFENPDQLDEDENHVGDACQATDEEMNSQEAPEAPINDPPPANDASSGIKDEDLGTCSFIPAGAPSGSNVISLMMSAISIVGLAFLRIGKLNK